VKVVRSLARARGCFEKPVVTIGNFDGVHRGHQVILDQVRRDADQRGVEAVALTFHPHPVSVLRPQAAPKQLMTLRDRLEALRECGLDATVVQQFSRSFADIEAGDFVRGFLVETLGVQKLVVGHDINFGRNRAGSTRTLVDEGRRYDFAVEVIHPVTVDGLVVHSSAVRRAVASGEVALAAKLLGRSHFVRGRCVHGAGVGRGLGFATVNLALATELVPADGVYATVARLGRERVDGVTSIGNRPTFDGGARVVESHLFEFDRDAYGEVVVLEFVDRLRDQKKFDDAAALGRQVGADIERAKVVLAAARGK